MTPRERGAVVLVLAIALIGLCARYVHHRAQQAGLGEIPDVPLEGETVDE